MTEAGPGRTPRSLRFLLAVFLGALGLLVGALAVIATLQQRSESARARAENRRNESFRLADSMRQSSNDLTLMVRLYVSTGDPRYRSYYDEILAIRNGTAPRPATDDSSLWDRVLAEGKGFVEYGPPLALVERMRAARFTDTEFDLLNAALRASDRLAVRELEVMDRVALRIAAGVDESYLADVATEYGRLVDGEYLSQKGDIMRAVGQFVAAVDARTKSQVDHARQVTRRLGYALLVVLGLVVAVGIGALDVLRRVAVRPLGKLVAVTRRIADGDYGQRAEIEAVAELEELAGAFDDMAGAVQRDIERRERAEHDAVEARQQADEANRAKSIFLASMSHEVRTPMTGVVGMLEVLGHTELSGEQRTMLGVAREAAQSLIDVTGDVLDLSKIEAGRLELAPTTLRIADLVEQVAGTYLHTASTKGLVLQWAVDDALAPAHRGDGLRLRQILSNFITNALKFTDAGSVSVQARSLGSGGDGDGSERVELAVVDTGVGVTPEQQSRLFQDYTQAEATTSQRFGGTGLGLSICRRLAELMGGRISMQSEVGAGTTMALIVDLPLGDEDDLPVADTGPIPRLRPGTDTPPVLLVDDHPVSRRAMSGQLRVMGFEVDTAENGQDALAALDRRSHVAVLTDVNMPVMDGYDLALAIRERQASGAAALPVVGLSANVSAEERTRCLAAGMDDFVGKPTTIAVLGATLLRWLPNLPWATVGSTPETATHLHELSGGDADLGAAILRDYVDSTESDLADLAAAIQAGDGEGIRRSAHRIKGASLTIGAAGVAGVAGELEQRAADLAPDEVGALLERLRAAVDEVAAGAR